MYGNIYAQRVKKDASADVKGKVRLQRLENGPAVGRSRLEKGIIAEITDRYRFEKFERKILVCTTVIADVLKVGITLFLCFEI